MMMQVFIFLLVVSPGFCLKCPQICNCSTVSDTTTTRVYVDCSNKQLLTGDMMTQGEKPISRKNEKDFTQDAGASTFFLNTSHTALKDDLLTSSYMQQFIDVYLQSISMCCSNISRVEPDAFKYAGVVGDLDISHNFLSQVSFIENLTLLEKLDLSYNQIVSVSVTDVRKLDQLKVLKLQGNRLLSLSFMVYTLPSLMHIDVSDNFLKSLLPKIFENKTQLGEVNIAENRIKMVSFCLLLPLLSENSSLQLVNMSLNPMTCDCHLVWILQTAATVVHSYCAQPEGWRSTKDVNKYCASTSKPICNSSNGTHGKLPWDPYATLPTDRTGAGQAKGSASTIGPQRFAKARVSQIVVLAAIGCIATVVVVVAVAKNRRLLQGKLNLKRRASSLKLAREGTNNIANGERQIELHDIKKIAQNHNVMKALGESDSWGNMQAGSRTGRPMKYDQSLQPQATTSL